MSATAILAVADDWRFLLGWVDQTTGEIAGPEPINTPLAMVAVFSSLLGCILAATNDFPWWALGFGTATVGIGLWVWLAAKLYNKLVLLQPRLGSSAP